MKRVDRAIANVMSPFFIAIVKAESENAFTIPVEVKCVASGAAVWPLVDTEPIAAAKISVTDNMRTMGGL
jgi:hypothetical protein